MKLYFVRHGESEANLLNVFSDREDHVHALTPLGKRQAFTLAEKLQDQDADIGWIYSSPLLRARQTASIIATRLHAKLQVTPSLREYDCGILEGRSDPASWEIYDRVLRDWMVHERFGERIEGGESFEEMEARFVPFVKEAVERHRWSSKDTLFVGHGGLYRCMLPRLLKNIDLAFSLSHPLGHTDCVIAKVYSPDVIVCEKWRAQEVLKLVV